MFIIKDGNNSEMINTDNFEKLRLLDNEKGSPRYAVTLSNTIAGPVEPREWHTFICRTDDYSYARHVYDTIQYHMVRKDINVLNLGRMEYHSL